MESFSPLVSLVCVAVDYTEHNVRIKQREPWFSRSVLTLLPVTVGGRSLVFWVPRMSV